MTDQEQPRQPLTDDDRVRLKPGDLLVLDLGDGLGDGPSLVAFHALFMDRETPLVLVRDGSGNSFQQTGYSLFLPTPNEILTLDWLL